MLPFCHITVFFVSFMYRFAILFSLRGARGQVFMTYIRIRVCAFTPITSSQCRASSREPAGLVHGNQMPHPGTQMDHMGLHNEPRIGQKGTEQALSFYQTPTKNPSISAGAAVKRNVNARLMCLI